MPINTAIRSRKRSFFNALAWGLNLFHKHVNISSLHDSVFRVDILLRQFQFQVSYFSRSIDLLCNFSCSPARQDECHPACFCVSGIVRVLGRWKTEYRTGASKLPGPNCWYTKLCYFSVKIDHSVHYFPWPHPLLFGGSIYGHGFPGGDRLQIELSSCDGGGDQYGISFPAAFRGAGYRDAQG